MTQNPDREKKKTANMRPEGVATPSLQSRV